MGTFQWIMKKVTKVFGRGTNALFYSLLYREILKEINEISENEEKSLIILREIGKSAALESCERHSGIFKFMPSSPNKVLQYFEILWSVVFGMDLIDYTYEEVFIEGRKYNDYILKINRCPLCGGYRSDEEDAFDFGKVREESEGLACGLSGMLESVANFILRVKKSEYRIKIFESKCIAKGLDYLELTCKIYDILEWNDLMDLEIKEHEIDHTIFKDKYEREVIQETKLDIVDEIQNLLSLDKLEEVFEQPLEGIQDRVANLIRDKMGMEPDHFFNYFYSYEDDLFRILGFLFVHILNEYGSLVEKSLENSLFSKVIGYIFKQLKEMTILFLPLDVINDYHDLLVNFLDGIAPPEMVQNVKAYTGKDDIIFFFEGVQIALENLGIDFSELKENIWEELRKKRENGLLDSEASMVDKSRDKFPNVINIVQEIVLLVSEFLTIPVRILVSESHYGVKTTINSIISEEEGLFGSFKQRMDNIFDQIQELRG